MSTLRNSPIIAICVVVVMSASVVEVVEDFLSDTYRAVYTVRFENAIYVLHCFKKKSTSGAKTPKPDLDLIRERLKQAEKHAKGVIR